MEQKERHGWREVRLGDLVDIKHGYAFKGKYITDETNNNILVTPGNFHIGGGFKSSKLKYFRGEIPQDYILKEGDVIVTMTDLSKQGDTLGFSAKVPKNNKNDEMYLHNQRIGLLQFESKEVDRNFIYWLMRTGEYHWFIVGAASGTSIKHTSPKTIKDYKFFLPPLPEQKAIAEVLSSLDDKIELLHRQNKTLEDMAQALFRKWFVEDANEGWEFGKLGDVVEIFDSKRIPLSKIERQKMKDGDSLYPYYGAAQVMDYINDYIFEGEYILMAEDGTVKAGEGYPVLQYTSGKFWVNNHTHVLKAKKPYDNFFIWHFLLKLNIERYITGAVQPKINQTNLVSIDFPKYPHELVYKFQDTVESVFDKNRKNKSQIRTLKKLRDILLPKLMSGKARISPFSYHG